MPSAVPPESGIPIIDLLANQPDDRAKYKQAASQLYEAFRDVGFAYITNHGVPEDEISAAFSWVSLTFVRPR